MATYSQPRVFNESGRGDAASQTAELKQVLHRANCILADLAREGCKVDIDVIEHQSLNVKHGTQVLTASVFKEMTV